MQSSQCCTFVRVDLVESGSTARRQSTSAPQLRLVIAAMSRRYSCGRPSCRMQPRRRSTIDAGWSALMPKSHYSISRRSEANGMGLTAEPVPFKLRPGTPHIQKTGRALACLRMICATPLRPHDRASSSLRGAKASQNRTFPGSPSSPSKCRS